MVVGVVVVLFWCRPGKIFLLSCLSFDFCVWKIFLEVEVGGEGFLRYYKQLTKFAVNTSLMVVASFMTSNREDWPFDDIGQ